MFLCGHINARSLLNNFDGFVDHLSNFEYDLLGVSETWLHRGINDNVLKINNYTVLRQDKDTRAGGLVVYLKQCFDFRVVLSECKDFLEHI